jgi:DNA-binding CsgD family transcriptional regulator
MSIWHTFQKFFRPETTPASQRSFALEGDLLLSLEQLAQYRGTTPRKVAADLLARELQSVEVEHETWEKWQSLTEREQQVAALICLQYRTQQIATRLQIAPETVRSHVHNILHKMELPNRIAMRQLLAGWDFSSWA